MLSSIYIKQITRNRWVVIFELTGTTMSFTTSNARLIEDIKQMKSGGDLRYFETRKELIATIFKGFEK